MRTPQQQLWSLTTPEQQAKVAEMFAPLKKLAQEDLALGLVAYLKWGFGRPYENVLMDAVYQTLVEVLDKDLKA